MTRVKICGLFRPCDIEAVNEAVPDYCGFIVHFPKSHRNVTPEQVRILRAGLVPAITPVGVFVDQPVEDVAALLNDGTLSVAQLHGHEDERYIAALRALAPGREVWKAFQVRSRKDLDAAKASTADIVLLDNGYGTGQTFDWSLIGETSHPYFLAGGLNEENITRAAQTGAYALDLSSGIETDDTKDIDKMRHVAALVKGAHQ